MHRARRSLLDVGDRGWPCGRCFGALAALGIDQQGDEVLEGGACRFVPDELERRLQRGTVARTTIPGIGMCAAGCVFLGWSWSRAWRASPDRTRELALDEDRSRRLVDALIIGATLASLVAVVFALVRSQQQDPIGVAAALLAATGVVVAWAVVNTVYAFKYARMYYHGERHRFDFDQDEAPSYSDFAYTASAIGMAYSASNVTSSSTPSRRIALGHALLSYFFGTVVVAVAINLVTSLAQGG